MLSGVALTVKDRSNDYDPITHFVRSILRVMASGAAPSHGHFIFPHMRRKHIAHLCSVGRPASTSSFMISHNDGVNSDGFKVEKPRDL